MKKTIPALLCLLCALAAGTAAFFGCTGGGDNPGGDSGDNTGGDPGGGTENSYSITATDGEGYDIDLCGIRRNGDSHRGSNRPRQVRRQRARKL